jgi:hypothetical protein
MIKMWIFAIVATSLALTQVRAVTTTFTLVGTSTKVCQLNGETDWASGNPTAAQTLTNFGMAGADLGAPVDTGGSKLYFLFGDTWKSIPPPVIDEVPPDDSVGTSTLKTTPTSGTCLDLKVATVPGSSPPAFAPPTVTPKIDQGFFNVPTGGVYAHPSLYVFFWTNHCLQPDKDLGPSPSDPLAPPTTGLSPSCDESNPALNSIGISVLGQSVTNDVTFTTPTVSATAVTMPSGFVYVNAVDATHWPNLAPSGQRLGVFITGVPRYRYSVPYLAYSTSANLGNPSNWMFFNGLTGRRPIWIDYTAWQSNHNTAGRWVPPSGVAQIYNATTSEECVGEHSLTWNAPLNAWLLLYNCAGSGIEARYAPAPWGPWSDPIVLLSPTLDPSLYCTLIMSPSGCPGLTTYWLDGRQGGLYAPFVLNRFTQDTSRSCFRPGPRPVGLGISCAKIYWLVSTDNPYVVVVMTSTLMITTFP